MGKAWRNKQKREEIRLAELKYYLAAPHTKNRLTIRDLLPDWISKKRTGIEEMLAESERQKALKRNGQK